MTAEKTVVVAEFRTESEAQVALAYLESESIQGSVTGDNPNPTSFSLFGRMQYAPIQLHVAESQAEKAKLLLSELKRQEPEKEWESEAESAVAGWMCQLCDTYVEDEKATACPSCGEVRPSRTKGQRG